MLTVYKQVTIAPLEAHRYFLWNDTDTQTHCDNPYPQLTTNTDTLSRTTQVSQYQKVKPIWILLKQETVSGSDISWVMFKSAPRSRQITMPAPNSVFYRPGALPAAQPTASKH